MLNYLRGEDADTAYDITQRPHLHIDHFSCFAFVLGPQYHLFTILNPRTDGGGGGCPPPEVFLEIAEKPQRVAPRNFA